MNRWRWRHYGGGKTPETIQTSPIPKCGCERGGAHDRIGGGPIWGLACTGCVKPGEYRYGQARSVADDGEEIWSREDGSLHFCMNEPLPLVDRCSMCPIPPDAYEVVLEVIRKRLVAAGLEEVSVPPIGFDKMLKLIVTPHHFDGFYCELKQVLTPDARAAGYGPVVNPNRFVVVPVNAVNDDYYEKRGLSYYRHVLLYEGKEGEASQPSLF